MFQTLEPPHTAVLVVSYSASTVSGCDRGHTWRTIPQSRMPVSPYYVRVIAITSAENTFPAKRDKTLNSSTLGDKARTTPLWRPARSNESFKMRLCANNRSFGQESFVRLVVGLAL